MHKSRELCIGVMSHTLAFMACYSIIALDETNLVQSFLHFAVSHGYFHFLLGFTIGLCLA